MSEEQNFDSKQEVHSNVVRAGKRTYFFDVKATKNNDLYLTITESKKSTQGGRISYQKHKVFLYKEDFEKFSDALGEAISKINELKQDGQYKDDYKEDYKDNYTADEDIDVSDYSSVDFEDLK